MRHKSHLAINVGIRVHTDNVLPGEEEGVAPYIAVEQLNPVQLEAALAALGLDTHIRAISSADISQLDSEGRRAVAAVRGPGAGHLHPLAWGDRQEGVLI